MKLKTIRPHYYEHQYKYKGSIYMAHKIHSDMVIKNGICEEIKKIKKNKKAPITKKGAIEKK